MLFSLFCRHEWEVVKEHCEKSPLEKLKEGGLASIKCDSEAVLGTYICILQCKKCGKLNKTIEKI